jgi:biopolymer transport protein ExbB/TolQ
MDILALLISFIYLISSSLLLPVVLLLSLATVWLLYYSGRFFGLWLARKRLPRQSGSFDAIRSRRFEEFSRPVRNFTETFLSLRQKPRADIAVLNLLRETEQQLWRSLDRMKLLIRLGPGLGLIGTLIPMGTGLAALSEGDLSRLSGDLVIAFTTTVVGMTLGLVGYFFFTVQRRWIEEDVKNMELLCELLMAEEQR